MLFSLSIVKDYSIRRRFCDWTGLAELTEGVCDLRMRCGVPGTASKLHMTA